MTEKESQIVDSARNEILWVSFLSPNAGLDVEICLELDPIPNSVAGYRTVCISMIAVTAYDSNLEAE